MTVTVTPTPPARVPVGRRVPRETHRYWTIAGTHDEVIAHIAEAKAALPPYNPYDVSYGEPAEQPDGTWVSKASSSLSCD